MLHICHRSTGKMTVKCYSPAYQHSAFGEHSMRNPTFLLILCLVMGSAASCAVASHHSRTHASTKGTVEGYLDTCAAIGWPNMPKYASGTVTVYGTGVHNSPASDPSSIMPPKKDAIAEQQVTPERPYRFVLPAGSYILVGTYGAPGSKGGSIITVMVHPGSTEHLDLPNVCI